MNMYDEGWIRHTGRTRIYAMVKDRTTVHVYLEVDNRRRQYIAEHFSCDWSRLPFYLCVYDVTDLWFDGYNAPLIRRIEVPCDVESWYIHGLSAGRNLVIDFATTNINDRLFSIVRSNTVHIPQTPHGCASPSVRFSAVVEPQIIATPQPYPYENEFDGYHLAEGVVSR